MKEETVADTISITSFVYGVGSALTAFIATNFIKRIYQGRKFRQRVMMDIEAIFNGHISHQPVLEKDAEKLKSALESDIANYEYHRLIWSNTYSLLPELLKNSAYLPASVFAACVEFYDIESRLEEVRKMHNDAACRAACARDDRENNLKFALYCLGELKIEYELLLQAGYKALRLMLTRYPSMKLDNQGVLLKWEKILMNKQDSAETGVLTVTA
jgi:hypothetical protein